MLNRFRGELAVTAPSQELEASSHGATSQDDDFSGDGDRVRYRIPIAGAPGPFAVDVELRYQPIGFRWGGQPPRVRRGGNPALHDLLRLDGRRLLGGVEPGERDGSVESEKPLQVKGTGQDSGFTRPFWSA